MPYGVERRTTEELKWLRMLYEKKIPRLRQALREETNPEMRKFLEGKIARLVSKEKATMDELKKRGE